MQARDDELWKLSGKVGLGGDTQVGSAREESLAGREEARHSHTERGGEGGWRRLCPERGEPAHSFPNISFPFRS